MEECNTEISAKDLEEQAKKTAQELILKLKEHSLTIAVAESCTAGIVSALLAGTPGASQVLWGCFVCYSKEAKTSMLGLDRSFLEKHGLVSRETACSMARCALQKSGADIASAVTGIAGPSGDGSGVPVGTVWIATAAQDKKITAKEFYFSGCRNVVRLRAAINLMNEVEALL